MKKNLLTIVILALLLVNIALTAVMMISVTTTNNKTANLVTTIATVMNLELTGGPGESGESETPAPTLADTEIFAIPESMTIPLKVVTDENGKQKQTYMVCDISLQIDKNHPDYKDKQPLLEPSMTVIKDAIRSVIASKTEEECRNNEEQLKAEILKAVQNLFEGSDFIYGVSIGEIKFG